MASFGVLSKKKIQDFIPPQTGMLRSTLRPSNLGPGGGLYNKPISCLQQIQQSAQYDDPMVKALKALDVGELHSDEWTCAEGIVLYRGRVYVLDNP